MGIHISHPYCAPAFVESTKWEVPIDMLANNRPGPRFLIRARRVDMVGWIIKL
jgi:hypothetical protein